MNDSVLVIDDSKLIHDLLDVRLAPEGVKVLHAYDGVHGIDMARTLQPNLILLDLVLETESGLDVCAVLMSSSETRDIPVIVLTGASDTENKVRCLDAGAMDYVTKPFDPDELRARVRVGLRLHRYQRLLARQARIDALTGCWNRGYLDERLAVEVASAWRYGRPLALVLVDLDHFKSINDTWGHPVGDRVIQRLAQGLIGSVRTGDTVGRLGGDEFAILVRETPLEGLQVLMDRLVSMVRSLKVVHRGVEVPLSVSVGGAMLSQVSAATPQEAVGALFGAADRALYDSKAAGRGRASAFVPDDELPLAADAG